MRLLILGATGMLGSTAFQFFSRQSDYETWGTMRSGGDRRYFDPTLHGRLIHNIDINDIDALAATLDRVRPQVVINAVGVIKQLAAAKDPLVTIPVNAVFPHRLARLCGLVGARMVHVSTDCVFSGRTGGYVESDHCDADDLYGRSKHLGEVVDQAHVVTLRTSGIGHELASRYGLVEWFLSQHGAVRGFTGAIYTGLPWVELCRVIKDVVVPHPELHGLYHISSKPTSKYELLRQIAQVYGKSVAIEPDHSIRLDRSLDASRFHQATGYEPPDWPELVRSMHSFHQM